MEVEQWKDFSYLQVSDMGRVMEKGAGGWQEVVPIENDGVLYVSIKTSFRVRSSYRKLLPIAGLVLVAHGNPVGENERVEYRDGNFRNCALDNLIKIPRKAGRSADECLAILIKNIESLPGEEWRLIGIDAACSNQGRFVDHQGLRSVRTSDNLLWKELRPAAAS